MVRRMTHTHTQTWLAVRKMCVWQIKVTQVTHPISHRNTYEHLDVQWSVCMCMVWMAHIQFVWVCTSHSWTLCPTWQHKYQDLTLCMEVVVVHMVGLTTKCNIGMDYSTPSTTYSIWIPVNTSYLSEVLTVHPALLSYFNLQHREGAVS